MVWRMGTDREHQNFFQRTGSAILDHLVAGAMGLAGIGSAMISSALDLVDLPAPMEWGIVLCGILLFVLTIGILAALLKNLLSNYRGRPSRQQQEAALAKAVFDIAPGISQDYQDLHDRYAAEGEKVPQREIDSLRRKWGHAKIEIETKLTNLGISVSDFGYFPEAGTGRPVYSIQVEANHYRKVAASLQQDGRKMAIKTAKELAARKFPKPA